MIAVSRDQLRAAAQLRAATGVKTPDALQMVSALGAGCRALLTNDRGLPSVPGLRVVQLSSYIERECQRSADAYETRWRRVLKRRIC